VDLRAALLIWDLRPGARQPIHIVSGLERELYLACDGMAGAASLKRCGAAFEGAPVSFERIQSVLDPLVQAGLMLCDEQTYLALAIPLGEYRPDSGIRRSFVNLVRGIGQPLGTAWHVGDLADAGSAPARTSPARPDLFSLSPEHFRIDEHARVLVDLDAVERIDLNLVRAQLTGVSA
jgi:hypothetical protein